MNPRGQREELERIWVQKLVEAEAKFRSTSAQAIEIELDLRLLRSPALQQVRRCEDQARSEYMRVLRLFTNLILDGEVPEEKSA